MPEISTEQKYARIFGLPEEDTAHADYDIFTNILTVTYGKDQPRYKQKKVTRRASKEFADYFMSPIFMRGGVDYILTAYLKAKGMNPVVRVYYTSTDPVFGKMSLRQFIETEVKERGNYTLADVQNWMRRYNISGNDLAIWVSPKKWVANRYNLPASEWDKAEKVPESEMSVYEIKGDEGFIIPESDDGEAGYLFVFNRPKEGKAVMVYEPKMPENLRTRVSYVSEKKESLIDALLNIQPGKDILIGYGDIPEGAERITLPSGMGGTVIERRGDLLAVGIHAGAAVTTVLYVKKDSQMIRIRPIPHQKMQTRTGEIVNAPEYNKWVERIKKEAPEYLPEWENITTPEKTELPGGKEMAEPQSKLVKPEEIIEEILHEAKKGLSYEEIVEHAVNVPEFKTPPIPKKVIADIMEYSLRGLVERGAVIKRGEHPPIYYKPPAAAVGSPYEVKATVSFIPRERVWSIIFEDSAGYCHGVQNYPRLREALDALETGELEQDFDRQSARQFYIRQIGLDPENPDDLKQIMEEYSEGHDPRRGIKITEILYTDEVKAQKVMLEHQYTSHELNALDIEALKKIAIAKSAKTTGKKEEVITSILQSQGASAKAKEMEAPLQEKKLYRYYFLHRPPDIGTQPENPVRTERWVLRSKTPLGHDAFGWAEYDRPLTNDEIRHFELFVDEPVMPRLVKELVQFAHDEGIDEAMRAIKPDDEYYRAVMAWLKAVGRERPQVNPMAQVRDEVIRLAGIKEKPVGVTPLEPAELEVLERFPTKSFLEPKIREYGKWIRENTYGEGGMRRLQTGSYEQVIATIKEFIRKYYNLAPAPADYIFRRPKYQQTEIGIDSLATTFFNVAANGWDLAESFKEWEAGETRQEWERRLKEVEKPLPTKPVEVAKPIESIQDAKQKLMQRIQSAGTVTELQSILKEIGAANLPEHEKQQLLDAYQNRFSILKTEEKPKILGAPSRQELWEAELRKKAEEGKKLRGQVTIGGAVSTAARLGLFEPGAMEKARAEAEARKRIEQLGLPYVIHPIIKKLAESKEYILKFGAVTGRETLEDLVLSRYKSYCPAGVIVDNRGIKGQKERWWVYPERLRACITEVQQKIAAVPAAVVAMVKESALSPSTRDYIRGAQAVRDVIHHFRDRRPPVRGVLYRARDGTYFVEANDGQIYNSMGWVEVDGWAVLEQASLVGCNNRA